MRAIAGTAVCVLVLLTAAPADQSERPSLAGLPSTPGPHIDRIRTLGDNAWANKTLPDIGPMRNPQT